MILSKSRSVTIFKTQILILKNQSTLFKDIGGVFERCRDRTYIKIVYFQGCVRTVQYRGAF